MKSKLIDISNAGAKVKSSLVALNTATFRKRIQLFFFLAVVAALGFWLWGLLASSGLTDQAIEFIRLNSRENRFLTYGFFIGLATISVLLGPFTSAPIVPVALLLWGPWTTFVLLMIGWMLGSVGAYAVGKYLGYPVVSKIVPQRFVVAWQNLTAHPLNFRWTLLFRLSMPAETGYIFGLAKYNFGKFLAATLLVELATGVLLVWGGDALVNRNIFQFTAWIAGGIILFAGAAYALRNQSQTGRE